MTSEYAGKDPATSISVHFRQLSLLLANNGFDVYILYTGYYTCEESHQWIQQCGNENISFVPLSDPEKEVQLYEYPRFSHRVYQWLKIRNFDFVHFPDTGALGYYSVLAREQHTAFHSTCFIVCRFGSSKQLRQLGDRFLDSPRQLKLEYMEGAILEKADFIIECQVSGGDEHTDREDQNTVLMPLLIPYLDAPIMGSSSDKNSLLFLSNLNVSGGIEESIEVCLTNIVDQYDEIIFIGKSFHLPTYGCDSQTLLNCRLHDLPIKIIADPTLEDIVEYITRPDVFVVLPNRNDTSVYAAMLCLQLGIGFAGFATSGHIRLIPGDVDQYYYNTKCSLGEIILKGPVTVKFPIDVNLANDRWLAWHKESKNPIIQAPAVHVNDPLVSVCMATYERPELLIRAVRSVIDQDYSRVELIIVDDGSVSDASQARLEQLKKGVLRNKGKIVQQENSGPACARNTAARHANGDYLIFMDDDNYALKYQVSTFVSTSRHLSSDILTCTSYCSSEVDVSCLDRWNSDMLLPIGNYPDLALFDCCMGDTNMFISAETFFTLDGFPVGEQDEDWDFLLSASLKGYSIDVIAEPLFIYYWHLFSNARSGNRYVREVNRVKLLNNFTGDKSNIIELAHGMARGGDIAYERKHILLPMYARSERQSKSSDLDTDQSLPLYSLHEGFYGDEGKFCWAQRYAIVKINKKIPQLVFHFANNALMRFERTQSIKLFKNNKIQYEITLESNGHVECSIDDLESGDQISFDSDFEFSPKQWGAKDTRNLSFMFFYPTSR